MQNNYLLVCFLFACCVTAMMSCCSVPTLPCLATMHGLKKNICDFYSFQIYFFIFWKRRMKMTQSGPPPKCGIFHFPFFFTGSLLQKIKKTKTNQIWIQTSLPYFRVKLSCVCLMFAFKKKYWPIVILWWSIVTLRWPIVTLRWPNMNYSGLKVTYS